MLIVFAVVLVGMTYFQMRAQKKQAQQRMESLNKLQKVMKSLPSAVCMER